MEQADNSAALRRRMVETQLRSRGIKDPRVLAAMEQVPRHSFVPSRPSAEAYGDHPLPIGERQTISQPYMVARMTELAAPFQGARALEVGAGCGYQSAVLAALGVTLFACEILPELARQCKEQLARIGCERVEVTQRDGSMGWSEKAPFDIILVAAGAPAVPEPLLEQLADGGRLIIPVGGQTSQVLQRITRQGEKLVTIHDTACRFVDLRGEYGWDRER